MNRVVSIHTPVGFSRQGRQLINEDYIAPASGRATEADRLFVVCDGEGAHQQGELASLLAAETLQAYVRTHPAAAIGATYLNLAVLAVEAAFDRAIRDEVEADLAGMSTTMSLLNLHQRGVTLAHIGDSSAFHIRDGHVLFQTENRHLPTEPGMAPAIRGSLMPVKPDVYETQDVAAGDYFFLGTAGVLEALTSTDIAQTLLSRTLTDRQKLAVMLDQCAEHSTANYSGYLIRVAAVEPMAHERADDEADSTDFRFTLSAEEAAQWQAQENRSWVRRLFS